MAKKKARAKAKVKKSPGKKKKAVQKKKVRAPAKAKKKVIPKKAAPKAVPKAAARPAVPQAKPTPSVPRPVKPKFDLPWRKPADNETFAGVVDDYFGNIGVITLFVRQALKIGDKIRVRGHSIDFLQIITSMQIDHASVSQARPGEGVGIKVANKAHKGNYIFKVSS